MVYDETEAFVLPINVTETIKGALVELTFRLKHYYIQDKQYDTFSATIEQIIVLKRAPPKQPSPYRRGAGPVHLPTTGPTRNEQVAAVSAFYPPVPAGSAPVHIIPTQGVATTPVQVIASQSIGECPETNTRTVATSFCYRNEHYRITDGKKNHSRISASDDSSTPF